MNRNILPKVVAVSFLLLTASAVFPVYAETGKREAAPASGYSEEDLVSGGFKPLSSLASEPSHISDRVKILHGRSHFILSNLNNFTYKPFHGENMWIGEFAIPDIGSRLEVVFNIDINSVIAVAGYRLIAEPPRPFAVPAAPSPAPPPVYVPRAQQPVVYKPVQVYLWKPTLNISMSFGEAALNKDYWKPLDRQATTSLTGDYNPGDWPVNLLVDFSYTSKAEGQWYFPGHGVYNSYTESRITEFSIGARKYLVDVGAVKPYISAGLSSISVDLSTSTAGMSGADNSSSIGYFGDAGIIFILDRFYMGFDLKALGGTSVNLLGASGDVNYSRWSVLFGVNF